MRTRRALAEHFAIAALEYQPRPQGTNVTEHLFGTDEESRQPLRRPFRGQFLAGYSGPPTNCHTGAITPPTITESRERGAATRAPADEMRGSTFATVLLSLTAQGKVDSLQSSGKCQRGNVAAKALLSESEYRDASSVAN